MFQAIGYNLSRLTRFSGRDPRSTFWPWFGFVALLNLLVAIGASIPTMTAAFDAGFAAAQSGDTAGVENAVMEQVVGFADTLVWLGIGVALANLLLLAASCVRRAHDSGLPGFLMLVPALLQLLWVYFSWQQLDGLEATMRNAAAAQAAGQRVQLDAGMVAQDLIGWLVIAIVVIIGLLATQPVTNQYGEVPDAG